jgi:hypothetical protein
VSAGRVGVATVIAIFVVLAAASTPATAGAARRTGAAVRAAGSIPRSAAGPAAAPTGAGSSTTIPGIAGHLPSLATIPFTTRPPNAHVSPIFAELSIGGFAVFVLIVVVQVFRPRRAWPGRLFRKPDRR